MGTRVRYHPAKTPSPSPTSDPHGCERLRFRSSVRRVATRSSGGRCRDRAPAGGGGETSAGGGPAAAGSPNWKDWMSARAGRSPSPPAELGDRTSPSSRTRADGRCRVGQGPGRVVQPTSSRVRQLIRPGPYAEAINRGSSPSSLRLAPWPPARNGPGPSTARHPPDSTTRAGRSCRGHRRTPRTRCLTTARTAGREAL